MENQAELNKLNTIITELKDKELSNEKLNSVLDLVKKNFILFNKYNDLNQEALKSIVANLKGNQENLEHLHNITGFNEELIAKLQEVISSVSDLAIKCVDDISDIFERLNEQ